MRTVRLEGETIWETGKETFGCGRPSTLYVLFAIVRCASDDWKDDIRLYYKTGGEIVPSIQNAKHTARNEYQKRQKRWSVEEPGTFMLFYFKLEADNVPAAELEIRSKTVSEYAPRTWEKDPASGQAGEQTAHEGAGSTSQQKIWQQIEKALIKEGKVKIYDFNGLVRSVWMSVSDSTLEDQFYNELTATQQLCWLQYMVWTQSDQPPHHSDEDFPGDVQLIEKLLMQNQLAGIGRKHTPPPEDTPPPGPSRTRKSSRTRRSPSASSSQDNAVDEVAEGFAGLKIGNDFPPLGS
jgi:hypothetical protein